MGRLLSPQPSALARLARAFLHCISNGPRNTRLAALANPVVGPLDILWVRRAPGPSTAFDNMTYIILALIAWALITRTEDDYKAIGRIAARVYAAGVVCGEAVHKLNNWLADRVTGRQPWPQPFIRQPLSPMSAEALLGAGNFILLSEEALEVECLFFPEPAPAPAPKRRRTRKTKVAAGG